MFVMNLIEVLKMAINWISGSFSAGSSSLISEDERVLIMNQLMATDPKFRESLFSSFQAWWVRNVLIPISDRVEGALVHIEEPEDREEIARDLTLRIVATSSLADIEEAMYKLCIDDASIKSS
tara:strand:+ start:496 stop:864 length:369 start_codon:yes stop_codon:yes gene_type:complete